MTKTTKRRFAAGGFVMTAAVLALASAAFACLQFRGKLTLSNGNGTGSTTEVVHSSGTYMGTCDESGATTVNDPPGNANLTTTVAIAPTGLPEFCTPDTHTTLPNGTYDVLVKKGTGADACRAPNRVGGSETGSVVVVVAGAGGTATPVEWKASAGTWHVCVSLSLNAGLGYQGIGTWVESV